MPANEADARGTRALQHDVSEIRAAASNGKYETRPGYGAAHHDVAERLSGMRCQFRATLSSAAR